MQITNQMQYLQTIPKSYLFPSKLSIAMTTAGEQGGAASISKESKECPCPSEGESSKLFKKKKKNKSLWQLRLIITNKQSQMVYFKVSD